MSIKKPGRKWRVAAVAAFIVLLVWATYRVTAARHMPAAMSADTGCDADANTVAEMSRLKPGAAPIRCEPWDIGTGVTGYVWHAPNPKAVLLLQHGYAEYAQRYVKQHDQLIPHLLAAGVSVYAIDLWGHGRSPGWRGLVDVDQALQDHLAARRKLQGQPLPLFLAGHSLGGLVAAGSVARNQDGVRGVILMSGALLYETSATFRAVIGAAAFIAPTIPLPRRSASVRDLYEGVENDAFVRNDPLIYRDRMPMLVAATGAAMAHDNWKLYPDWKVPVLMMHGTKDTWTNPEGSRMLFTTVASQDKALHLVDGGYHELLNDTRKSATRAVLLTWLERRLQSGSK
ncbi:MAG: alpha/beta fold hydrolase [Vicinamibacterales bacterium]